jgi:hypothetical protein
VSQTGTGSCLPGRLQKALAVERVADNNDPEGRRPVSDTLYRREENFRCPDLFWHFC